MPARNGIAVLMATVTVGWAGLPVAHAATCPNADLQPTADSIAPAIDATLCLANEQRAAAGAPALSLDGRLAAVAENYARTMVQQRFFSHVAPNGSTFEDRFAAAGLLPDNSGENLFPGTATLATPAATVDSWMNSPSHRENLLDPTFRQVGIGIVAGTPLPTPDPGATYVAEFSDGTGKVASADAPQSGQATAAQLPVTGTASAQVRRTVRAWVAAAHTGDGPAFCRMQDNRMLQASHLPAGAVGIAACVNAFRPATAASAASTLSFVKV